MKVYDYLKKKNRAQSLEDLVRALHLDAEGREDLLKELHDLEAKGMIRQSRQGKYLLNKQEEGVYKGHLSQTGKSYGFFIHEEEDLPDVFIHASRARGAMDGDQVLIRMLEHTKGESTEGEVVRILKRKHKRMLGIYHKGYVQPLSRKIGPIFLSKDKQPGVRVGEIVEVEILRYEEGHQGMEGKITRNLGEEGTQGLDTKVVMEEFDLPEVFPEEVLEEARALRLSQDQRRRVEDLVFTIDGADAKDFDDAISIRKLDKGYKLGVHIADVSHYVKEGSALDQEALDRGTSVYLVDKVVPMLPEELSNELCSLNPGEDKLCLSVVMELDESGKVLSSDIFPSILQSSYRLVYDDITAFLEGEENQELEPIRNELEVFKELTLILRKRRDERGAIDFGSNEAEFILDEKGWPLEVKIRQQGLSNYMIEEAMILTNEVVSQHFHWLQVPFLYRSHENPDREKMAELNQLLHGFGYLIKGSLDDVHPKQLNELLKQMKGKPEEVVLRPMMLRYLKQAHYSDVLQGHFGLALEYYSHFTAPIRRYPDLQIHRIIKEALGGLSEKRAKHYEQILPRVAEQSSERERRADEAERRMDDIKKAEYMKDHLGEVFKGRVSGVTNFGVFVELENTVEGMIRLENLKDYYRLDKEKLQLKGDRGGVISLGQEVLVEAESVEVYLGEINFLLVDEDEATAQRS